MLGDSLPVDAVENPDLAGSHFHELLHSQALDDPIDMNHREPGRVTENELSERQLFRAIIYRAYGLQSECDLAQEVGDSFARGTSSNACHPLSSDRGLCD